MSASYHFEDPEHFTAGAIGPRGQRVFYLQFGNPGELVSLKVEKGQVHALAEFLDRLLGDLDPLDDDDVPLALDLIDPVESEWVVANIGVAYNEDAERFILLAEELLGEDDGEEIDAATAQLHLSPGQVQAFIGRARELVASGRPPCDFCGRPLDHEDGWCPCRN